MRPIYSTQGGIEIDLNESQCENASRSILFNLDSDSNDTIESDLQPEKQNSQRISTEAGIHID
jgi:hypothetical protein